MMFGRLDYDDDNIRKNTSQREIIWQSSSSLGNVADIFTEILYRHYAPPKDFCYDLLYKCTDPPIMVSYSMQYIVFCCCEFWH